jgi:uncharacterized coiled-coil protein SlyX
MAEATNQTQITILNPDGTLSDEFKTQLVNLLDDLLATEEVQYSEIVKEYVEKQLNSLESKLLNNDQWEKVKENVEALLKVFDSNADGTLTPEEVLAKLAEIKAAADNNTKAVADIASKLEANVKELTEKIATNAANIDNLKTQVAQLQSDVDAKVQEAKDTAAELVDGVKSELGGKIETVNGVVTQVQTKVVKIETVADNAIDALEEMIEAFKEASEKAANRFAKVRAVFGLDTEVSSTDSSVTEQANIDGDGAVV